MLTGSFEAVLQLGLRFHRRTQERGIEHLKSDAQGRDADTGKLKDLKYLLPALLPERPYLSLIDRADGRDGKQ